MLTTLVHRVQRLVRSAVQAIRTRTATWTKPAAHSLIHSTMADLSRSKRELIIENALLRQQLIVLNRSVKRPYFTRAERGLFVLLASRLQNWNEALLIVKPETVLRWHRQGFRLFWKWKSRAPSRERSRTRRSH